MALKKLSHTLDFVDANWLLSTAHEHEVEDEFYIINLLCLQQLLEQHKTLRDKNLVESIRKLKGEIISHEKIILARGSLKPLHAQK